MIGLDDDDRFYSGLGEDIVHRRFELDIALLVADKGRVSDHSNSI